MDMPIFALVGSATSCNHDNPIENLWGTFAILKLLPPLPKAGLRWDDRR